LPYVFLLICIGEILHQGMTAAEPEMPKLFETGKHCHDGEFLHRLFISNCNFNHGIFALS
jgi:hypothetical protein